MTGAPTFHDWFRSALFLPPESSSVAWSIDYLHIWVIATTMIGAAAVAAIAVYLLIRYRHRGEDLAAARPPAPTTPTWLELSIGLGLFGLFFVWWVVGFTEYTRERIAPPDTYDIYVTAKQWMWKFSYAEGRRSIAKLYVPTGRPVRLLMSSRDVIHSLFVPDFRLKQDVIPGRYTTMWFEVDQPGRHEILCAEYCGTNHSAMRGEVIALPPQEFAAWLASADEGTAIPPPSDEDPAVVTQLGPSPQVSLVALGQAVLAQQGCLRCHTLDGSPHIGPSFAGVYRSMVPLADGTTVVADEAYLTESMMDPAARVRAGFAPVMPSYLGRLDPGEVAAILALIRSLATAPPVAAVAPAGGPGPAEVPPASTRLPSSAPRLSGPAPEAAGLSPPGTVALPPMRGTVEIGPKGPIVPDGGTER